MGHSTNCATRNGWYGTNCDCGFGKPQPTLNSVEDGVHDRIREIEDELNETFMLIGKIVVAGGKADVQIGRANEMQSRIYELKNVLNMIGG